MISMISNFVNQLFFGGGWGGGRGECWQRFYTTYTSVLLTSEKIYNYHIDGDLLFFFKVDTQRTLLSGKICIG